MKKTRLGRKLALVILLVAIFHLSSTPFLKVVDSSSWFNKPEYRLDGNLSDIFETDSRFYADYFPENSGIQYASIDFFAHKISHMVFYGLLAVMFLINISFKKHRYKSALFLVILTAIADEMNQYMIKGRTGMFLDVVLDVLTASVVLLLTFVISKIRFKRASL